MESITATIGGPGMGVIDPATQIPEEKLRGMEPFNNCAIILEGHP